MVQYKCATAEEQKFPGVTDNLTGIVLFNPHVPDFAVNMIKVKFSKKKLFKKSGFLKT